MAVVLVWVVGWVAGGGCWVCCWLSLTLLLGIFFWTALMCMYCILLFFQQSKEKIEAMQRKINDQNERFQQVQKLPGMLQVIRDAQEKGLLRKSVVE